MRDALVSPRCREGGGEEEGRGWSGEGRRWGGPFLPDLLWPEGEKTEENDDQANASSQQPVVPGR